MIKLRINPLVVTVLKAIKDYIAEDNAEAARKTVDEIFKSLESLQQVLYDGSRFVKESEFQDRL